MPAYRRYVYPFTAPGVIREERRIKTLVIDVEKDGYLSFGLARRLAEGLEAQYYKIEDLKADTLVKAIRALKDCSLS